MVTASTKQFVLERDGYACVFCGSSQDLEQVPHHGLFRSQYNGVMYDGMTKVVLNDQHKAWNLFTICRTCHHAIHHGNSDEGQKIKAFFVDLAKRLHKLAEGINPKWTYQPTAN